MQRKSLIILIWVTSIFSVLSLIALFSLIFLQSPLYNEVIYPSYLSVGYACRPDGEQFLTDRNQVVSGVTTQSIEPNGTVSVTATATDLRTAKHEFCHVLQATSDTGLYGCDKPFRKFLQEIECYTAENEDKIKCSFNGDVINCK